MLSYFARTHEKVSGYFDRFHVFCMPNGQKWSPEIPFFDLK
jgi:hypothetical protein